MVRVESGAYGQRGASAPSRSCPPLWGDEPLRAVGLVAARFAGGVRKQVEQAGEDAGGGPPDDVGADVVGRGALHETLADEALVPAHARLLEAGEGDLEHLGDL